ncbi:MAG: hypothetical protein JWO13_811 [Acidobacteriales bacterium]|nr:hypothetical protein [Terriglobales bacterium]
MSRFVPNSTGQFTSNICMNVNCQRDRREHIDGECPTSPAAVQPESQEKAAAKAK